MKLWASKSSIDRCLPTRWRSSWPDSSWARKKDTNLWPTPTTSGKKILTSDSNSAEICVLALDKTMSVALLTISASYWHQNWLFHRQATCTYDLPFQRRPLTLEIFAVNHHRYGFLSKHAPLATEIPADVLKSIDSLVINPVILSSHCSQCSTPSRSYAADVVLLLCLCCWDTFKHPYHWQVPW